MTEEKQRERVTIKTTPDIWVPPEKLDPNVQRMAWLLFLEWWKVRMAEGPPFEDDMPEVGRNYEAALEAAKIVRELENPS